VFLQRLIKRLAVIAQRQIVDVVPLLPLQHRLDGGQIDGPRLEAIVGPIFPHLVVDIV
jgi:hypothetical protein